MPAGRPDGHRPAGGPAHEPKNTDQAPSWVPSERQSLHLDLRGRSSSRSHRREHHGGGARRGLGPHHFFFWSRASGWRGACALRTKVGSSINPGRTAPRSSHYRRRAGSAAPRPRYPRSEYDIIPRHHEEPGGWAPVLRMGRRRSSARRGPQSRNRQPRHRHRGPSTAVPTAGQDTRDQITVTEKTLRPATLGADSKIRQSFGGISVRPFSAAGDQQNQATASHPGRS